MLWAALVCCSRCHVSGLSTSTAAAGPPAPLWLGSQPHRAPCARLEMPAPLPASCQRAVHQHSCCRAACAAVARLTAEASAMRSSSFSLLLAPLLASRQQAHEQAVHQHGCCCYTAVLLCELPSRRTSPITQRPKSDRNAQTARAHANVRSSCVWSNGALMRR